MGEVEPPQTVEGIPLTRPWPPRTVGGRTIFNGDVLRELLALNDGRAVAKLDAARSADGLDGPADSCLSCGNRRGNRG